MANIELYGFSISPFTRSVLLAADAMGLSFPLNEVNTIEGQQFSPEFLKLNPHHTIPVLVETFSDGSKLILNESRAIIRYLANLHSPELYPIDPKKRALVDQALDFEATSLSSSMAAIFRRDESGIKINKELTGLLDEKLKLLDDDLSRTQYVAGNELSIADFSTLSIVTNVKATGLWEVDCHKNILNWIKKIKDSGRIKNYEYLVETTSKALGDFIKEKLLNSN